ncbi:MAG UNVERIFIED_CONTAM: hypothetical protein LVQ98_03680 [Rickettsiaceae bacterium]|jgi:hypothetical protein
MRPPAEQRFSADEIQTLLDTLQALHESSGKTFDALYKITNQHIQFLNTQPDKPNTMDTSRDT